jgi:hypothetical protein
MLFIINNLFGENEQNLADSPAIIQDSRSQWKWRAFSYWADLWRFPRSSLMAISAVPFRGGMELEKLDSS